MLFDSNNIENDTLKLKDEFQNVDSALSNIESIISNLSSNMKSPTLDYFKNISMKSISRNSDILANHFLNIGEYLEIVKDNYNSF